MSTIHRFTVEQFDRMIDGGVFAAEHDARVELIAGELRDMNPPRPMHDEVVDRLKDWADQHNAGRAFRARTEQPINLPDQDSVPYPISCSCGRVVMHDVARIPTISFC